MEHKDPNTLMLETLKGIKEKLENPDSFDSLMLFEILDAVNVAINSAESQSKA